MNDQPIKKKFRPEKIINWKLVDELLLAGCLGTEIAPHFDMHVNTFYDRVKQETGVCFTEYSTEKRSKGESLLRHQQYKKALGVTTDGDNTLLIWLGKNRLHQRDAPQEINVSTETLTQFEALMSQMRQNQSCSQRNIEDKSINNDAKSE